MNFHSMVLSLHYYRDPKNTFPISSEGCMMDRGGYQYHPALCLHLEKNKWLKIGILSRWICLGMPCSPPSLCHRSQSDINCHLLLKLTTSVHGWIRNTGRSRWQVIHNLLGSRKQAMWLSSYSGPECVAFTSAVRGCWNLTPCVLMSITRSVLGECMESTLCTSR